MQAFNLVTVIANVPWKSEKISALAATDNTIFTGTTEGKIYSFNVKVHSAGAKPVVSLENSRDLGHGKKNVTKVELFRDLGLLFCLCDNYFDILNVFSLEHVIPGLPRNKDILNFCIEHSNIYRFCVQIKKKLQLYEYNGKYNFLKEIRLPELPLQFEWAGAHIVLAFKQEYQLLNVDTGTFVPIFRYESAPCMRFLSSSEILLRQNNLGLFVNMDRIVTRSSLTFSNGPLQFAFKSPYVISHERHLLEVHNIHSQKLIQTIASLSYSSIYDGAGAQRLVWLYSATAVACLVAVPLVKQVEQLIRAGRVDEGIELFEKTWSEGDGGNSNNGRDITASKETSNSSLSLPNYELQLNAFHELAGDVLMANMQVEKAMTHYLASTTLDPRRLFAYFPELIVSAPGTSASSSLPSYLTIIKRNINVSNVGETKVNEMLAMAKLQLLQYLERAELKHKYKPAVLRGIHVGLIKLYATVPPPHPPDLQPLSKLQAILLKEPDLPFEELEAFLRSGSHWRALALLYKSFQKPRKALEVWAKLGSGEYVEVGLDAAHAKSYAIENSSELLATLSDLELITDFATWIYKESPEHFKKIFTSNRRAVELQPKAVVNYMRSVSPAMEQFYLEFLVFEQGTKVDTFHTELALYYLSALRTLLGNGNFVGVSTQAPGTESGAIGPLRSKLLTLLKQSTLYNAFEILQHIVTSASKNPEASATSTATRSDRVNTNLFDELVILYTRTGEYTKAIDILVFDLQAYARAEEYCLEHDRALHTSTLSAPQDSTLQDTSLSSLSPSNAATSPFASRRDGEDDISKLSPSLSRMAGSSPSHSSLVPTKKENTPPTKPKHLLVYLLTLYVRMQPGDSTELSPRALELLNKYPTELNPVLVLQALPENVSVRVVASYLTNAIRQTLHMSRESMIIESLHKYQNLKVNLQRIKITKRSVRINQDTQCPVCKTRLGDKVFAYFPNGVVVHFKCFDPNQPHICPVTGRNFLKRPLNID
jgi:hypothetical protein